MNKIVNNQIFLAFIGLLLVSFIVWRRFIQIRLPKEIPWIFTDLKFVLLSFTCLILFVSFYLILKQYFYPTISNITGFNYYITESLRTLDRKIKDINFIWIRLESIHIKVLDYTHKYIEYNKYIYGLFQIPKIIVPIALVIDILYFHKIEIFYKLLPLLVIPLLYRYIYHSLHFFYSVRKYYISEILTVKIYEETEDEVIFYTITEDPIHYLIQETTLERMGVRDSKHMFHYKLSDAYINENSNEDFKNFKKVFKDAELELTLLSKLYEILNTANAFKTKYSLLINLFTIGIYCICWTYILFTGYYTLSEEFLTFINTFKENIEPFSGIYL